MMVRNFFFRALKIINLNYFPHSHINNRLYILAFHQINNKNSKFYPAITNQVFEQICLYLSKRFNVISISEIDDYLKKSHKPAVIISFDDGHYDILQNAYPILQRLKLKFNINIVTESLETLLPQDNILIYDVLNSTHESIYINNDIYSKPIRIEIDKNNPKITEMAFVRLLQGTNKEQRSIIVHDVIRQLANKDTAFSRVLSKDDIRFLQGRGAEIGSHTHSHPILLNSDVCEIEFELSHSKRLLEQLCKTHIDIIAFPDGKCNEFIMQKSVEAGYKYLLLTEDKKNIMSCSSNKALYRLGLHHQSADENLAKIFGFHQSIHSLKSALKNVYHS